MSYSSLDYYRSTHPGWGTSQLRFREPPPPAFTPSPTWSGWDYYRAYAANPNQDLYYTVMNRTREFGANGGADMQEARHWQRRVYSGMVNPATLLPQEIGMAAAYEAYRMWKYHRGPLFDPLMSGGMGGSVERVREALVGLAIAEASRLWQYTGRAMDTYGLRDCLESAALAAFRISYAVLEAADSYGSSYPAGGGVPMPGSLGGESYTEPYEDPYRRARRHSTSIPMVMQQQQPIGVAAGGVGGFAGPPSPYMGGSPMPIPGRPASRNSSIGVASPYSGGLGTTPPYPPSGMPVSPYGGAGIPPTAPSYATASSMGAGVPMGAPSAGMPMGVPSYAGSAGLGAGGYPQGGLSRSYSGSGLAGPYGVGAGMPAQPYAGAGYAQGAYPPTTGGMYPQAAGGAYPQAAGGAYGYPGGAGAGTVGVEVDGRVIPAQPGSTIIIKSRPRRHSHRHHRSRSIEPLRDERYGREGVSYARY